MKQELFCEYYVSQDIELFGNGTKSYIEAYNPKRFGNWYEVAAANASRLLKNAKIIKRINSLLEVGGFTDENVDKQHLFLINQHADLKTKLGAIREFNMLKKRITNKLDLTSGGKPIPLFDNVSNNDSDKKDSSAE
jgi:hypothetical protein